VLLLILDMRHERPMLYLSSADRPKLETPKDDDDDAANGGAAGADNKVDARLIQGKDEPEIVTPAYGTAGDRPHLADNANAGSSRSGSSVSLAQA
jgi:hypothetical protein